MTKAAYQTTTGLVFAIAIGGVAVVWTLSGRIYSTGGQVRGWSMGMAGLALPAIGLIGCSIWLRWQRGRGQSFATVPWLKWAPGISAGTWIALMLFSLM